MLEKVLKYTVFFEPATEGGFIAYVPTLPGLVTQGETLEEAKVMTQDAVEGYLSVLIEDGQEIPVEPEATEISKIKVRVP